MSDRCPHCRQTLPQRGPGFTAALGGRAGAAWRFLAVLGVGLAITLVYVAVLATAR